MSTGKNIICTCSQESPACQMLQWWNSWMLYGLFEKHVCTQNPVENLIWLQHRTQRPVYGCICSATCIQMYPRTSHSAGSKTWPSLSHAFLLAFTLLFFQGTRPCSGVRPNLNPSQGVTWAYHCQKNFVKFSFLRKEGSPASLLCFSCFALLSHSIQRFVSSVAYVGRGRPIWHGFLLSHFFFYIN